MTFIVSLIAGFVTNTVIKAMLTRAVVALGIAAVTYTGISIAYNSVVSAVQTNLTASTAGALGAQLAAFLNLCSIPQAFSIVLSSYAAALTLRGLSAAGAITKVGITSAPGSVFSPGTF